MNRSGSISVLHAFLLVITMIGLKSHITVMPSLLKGAGRDGWLSILIAALVIFLWIFLLIYIHKKSNQEPIADWLDMRAGKVIGFLVRYMTAGFLIILASFTMVETLKWVVESILPTTPVMLMLITSIILCIYFVTTNLETMAMVNVIILFWITIFGILLLFGNMKINDYELLLPFQEHGLSRIFKSSLYPAAGFIELLLLLFIQHKVKDRFRWSHFVIALIILTGIIMIPYIGIIKGFGPVEAAKQNYPTYEEWRLLTLGSLINHLDFIAIYQWLTGSFIRMGLILFIAVDLVKMTGNKKRIWKFIAPLFFTLCLTIFYINDELFLKIKGEYLLRGTLLFMFVLSLLLGIIALMTHKKAKKV